MRARPTILQNQDVTRVSCHPVSSTVPCISMILLLSRYVVLAMTETNTVWYVKTQGCSHPCKQKRNWGEFRVWGEDSWNIKFKWVGFSYTRLKPRNRCRIYKCGDWAAGKYQGREGGREGESAFQRANIAVTGTSTERMSANTWSNPAPTWDLGFINTFHCYYSWENWHSKAPDAHVS